MQQNLGHVLNGRPAPVHTQHGAVNIGGVVAGQEHHRGGDLCYLEAALDVGIESLRAAD
jgi:hypothetical protein